MGGEQLCEHTAVSRNKGFLIRTLKAAMACSNNLRRVCHLLPLPLPLVVSKTDAKSTGAGAVGTGSARCAVMCCDVLASWRLH